jgi:Protein of unknown function (DUF2795)
VVERGSTQHSGRVDDALAEEVEPLVRSGHEGRANDDRLHEPPADDEPTPDARIAGEDQPSPGLLDLDEIEARSQLAASLRPSAFPADRDALYDVALEQHAGPDVLEALQSLPATIRFVNVQQVWEALGGERERRDVGDASVRTGAEGQGAGIEPGDIEGEAVDAFDEPVEVEIEIELELEAEDEYVPEVAPGTAPSSAPEEPGTPWWVGPLRTGVGVATMPLRVGAGVLRFVGDRLRR